VPAPEWLAELDRLLGLEDEASLRYDDARRRHSRRVRVEGDRLVAARIAGGAASVAGAEWLREFLDTGASIAAVRRQLLCDERRGPVAPFTRIVCQCHGVAEGAIRAALAEYTGDERARVEALGQSLACGTSCGSCRPELRALAGQVAPKAGRMVA
jgi:assimilatory nitrate reductase catalytic subunit